MSTAGSIDERGIAQIPIDRAMQIVVDEAAKDGRCPMKWIRLLLFLPPGGSTFADGIDLLHLFVISMTMLAATGIAALTLYYMMRYRRRSPTQATQQIRGSMLGEVGIIGSVLALFLLFWVIGFAQYVRLETPPDDAMVINVTAKQWMWKFSYPGGRRAINVLTVPVARPVKLAHDVARRDPQLLRPRISHQAGRHSRALRDGVVRGDRARQLRHLLRRVLRHLAFENARDSDGRSRSRTTMPGSRAKASDTLPDEDFAIAGGAGHRRQLRSRRSSVARSPRAGSASPATRSTASATSVRRGAGSIGATIPLEDGRTIVADEAYLTRSMMDPLGRCRTPGFKPVMPTYQGVLTAPEAAALVEYIKSLREGDVEPERRAPTSTASPARRRDARAPRVTTATMRRETTVVHHHRQPSARCLARRRARAELSQRRVDGPVVGHDDRSQAHRRDVPRWRRRSRSRSAESSRCCCASST